MNQLTRIETMLKAILASNNHINWVGSYAHGRTSDGDPYIVLFPASNKLEHQVCRVYESQFKKLPNFVNMAVPTSVKRNKRAPGKNQATPCRHFQVITCDGRDTQMGKERRFFGVLAIGNQGAQETAAPQPPAPSKRAAKAAVSTTRPEPTEGKDWRAEAASCTDAFMFDTAVVQAEPWFQDSAAVTQFREIIFGDWQPAQAAALVAGLLAYAKARKGNKSHDAAKKAAVTAHKKALATVQIAA